MGEFRAFREKLQSARLSLEDIGGSESEFKGCVLRSGRIAVNSYEARMACYGDEMSYVTSNPIKDTAFLISNIKSVGLTLEEVGTSSERILQLQQEWPGHYIYFILNELDITGNKRAFQDREVASLEVAIENYTRSDASLDKKINEKMRAVGCPNLDAVIYTIKKKQVALQAARDVRP